MVTRSARKRGLVVAIDGPAGSGKTTVSQRVAERLGYTRVNTGALYRAVALRAREERISWDDGPALGALAARLELAFVAGPSGVRLHVDGRDREEDLHTPEVSQGASIVSAHPEVRAALLDLQRALGAEGGVVFEGRDIGTVVFPDAEVKIFLTASDEERARRRQAELSSRGTEVAFQTVLADLRERDERDTNRAVAPLAPAPDAVRLDTTRMTLEQVVARVVELVRAAGG